MDDDDDDDEESKDDLLSSSRNESIPRCFFPGGLFEMSAGYIHAIESVCDTINWNVRRTSSSSNTMTAVGRLEKLAGPVGIGFAKGL